MSIHDYINESERDNIAHIHMPARTQSTTNKFYYEHNEKGKKNIIENAFERNANPNLIQWICSIFERIKCENRSRYRENEN